MAPSDPWGAYSRGRMETGRPDVARSLTDPNTLVVIEVFTSRQALERQNAQGEVANVLSLIEAGALTGDYEWTVWETSATE